MAIQWTDDLSVGVKEIDEQHQEFIRLLNHFYDLVYQAKGQKELDDFLKEISVFADKHFSTEEKYFDQFKYESADEHKEEHRKILQKIADFQARFDSDEEKITLELADFLEDWLVDHLGKQDMKYSEFFHSHGLV